MTSISKPRAMLVAALAELRVALDSEKAAMPVENIALAVKACLQLRGAIRRLDIVIGSTASNEPDAV